MVDRTELEAAVAAGQKAQETLSRLRALDTMDDEIAELRAAISKLEDAGSFGEAGPLKVKLARLASRGGAP